jgi:signal transduction histidine kinase/CheY-like chemotaxis protein
VLAAAGLGWLLAPWVGAESAYLLFTVAAMVSARYGGLWSGVAATLLGAVLALAVFASAPGSPAQWLLCALFVAVGGVLSYLTDTPRSAGRLEAALAEAAAREQALRESEQRLLEAGRLKDEFLATVAHELRTPLGAMLGWANVLREIDVDPATSTRALDAILRNARLQTRLISDLLDVSRMVAGTMRIDLQTVEPVAVIRAALETVRPAAEAKGVTLTAHVDAEAGPMTGDRSRLQQVLWNLLSNSIKFTPAGGTVAVRAHPADGQIEVTVEDTGPGIPTDFLPHVFDRFRQAGGAATPKKGGLGLGLAIARHLVELHGGTIAVANRDPGPGALFTVRLPLAGLRPGETRASTEIVAAEEPIADARVPSLEGLHVLVADEDEVREMVTTVLARRGARVTALPSVNDAFPVLGDLHPDVLLLDLEMADAGADSFIRKVRALPREKGGGVPAVALAAFGAADRTRALLAGFQLQLVKPVRPGELVAAVASVTGRTGQPAEAQEARA